MVPRSEFLTVIKECEFRRKAEASEIDAKIVILERELTRADRIVQLATAEASKVNAKMSCMVHRSELQVWIGELDAAKAQAVLVSAEHEKHAL